MSTPKAPDPAKLVISVFMGDKAMFEELFLRLERIAGPLDLMTQWLDFDFTSYYHKEMGSPLFRRMLAFKPLIGQGDLAKIKLDCNRVEHDFGENGSRRVNIDPGYLLKSRFILATGKDYSHRIYIGRQIYAELTLMYTKQGFKSLDWTYPDYASPEITGFLTRVREKYILDLSTV